MPCEQAPLITGYAHTNRIRNNQRKPAATIVSPVHKRGSYQGNLRVLVRPLWVEIPEVSSTAHISAEGKHYKPTGGPPLFFHYPCLSGPPRPRSATS